MLACLTFGLSACVLEVKNKCGENQRFFEDSCLCVVGAALTSQGCILCGANEAPVGSECSCVVGYERTSADAACTQRTSKLGIACDTIAAPCADPKHSRCQLTSGTAGYCTMDNCNAALPCEGDYACDTNGASPYCRRPPIGLGKMCAGAQDCAGTEATYCESFRTNQCFVEACTTSPNNCFPGLECCNIALLGKTLCLPTGGCAAAGGTQ